MSSGFGNILYYLNTLIWILAWILIAVAAGIGARRSGRKIHTIETILAWLIVAVRIATTLLFEFRMAGSTTLGYYMSNFIGVLGALLMVGFAVCYAIDKFTTPRPNQSSFPVAPPAPQNAYQQYR